MSLVFNLIAILVKSAPALASLLAQLAKLSSDPSPRSHENTNDLAERPRTAKMDLHDAMLAKWGRMAAREEWFVPNQSDDASSIECSSDELRQTDGFKRE